MSEGDEEAHYAYYCLHKLKMLPNQFFSMDMREKAAVIAFIDIRIEEEKKEYAKSSKKGRRKR